MAPVHRRLRLYAWLVRRQTQGLANGEEAVLKIQSRHVPDNDLTNFVLGKAVPGTEVRDRVIESPAGDIPLRIYRHARTRLRVVPLIMNFHGGGFVFDDPRLSDWLVSNVARKVGAVVVSVDYRLAARHRFPAAVDDCYAASAGRRPARVPGPVASSAIILPVGSPR